MRTLALIIIGLHLFLTGIAQPTQMVYRAVVCGNSGKVLANKSINVRINLLGDDVFTNSVYEETRQVTTDKNGYFQFEIGSKGTLETTGNFVEAVRYDEIRYLMAEADFNRDDNYVVLGSVRPVDELYTTRSARPAHKMPGAPALAESTDFLRRMSDTNNGYWFVKTSR